MENTGNNPPNANTPKDRTGRKVVMLRGDAIQPVPVNWLWPGWLAMGKLGILAGHPGSGKTTIGIALAAALTSGGNWPDGSPAPRGTVIMWSGEDTLEDVLIPRLIASGGDRTRFHCIRGVSGPRGSQSFDPAHDMHLLSPVMSELPGPGLLVLDPIVSAVAGDSHRNAEVRRALQPLVDLAERQRYSVLGITHLTKGTAGQNPVERVTGSLAFGAMARIVTVALKLSEADSSGDQRAFMRAKSNIGPDTGGFSYEVAQEELTNHPGVVASHVRWGPPVNGNARDLLAQAESIEDEDSTTRREIIEWLRDLLSLGPKTVSEVKTAAKDAGWAWRSVERERPHAGVTSRRNGFGGTTIWSIAAPSTP